MALGLDVALASALRHHLVVRGGAGVVDGFACTRWSSRDPLDSGPLLPPSGGDVTISCVRADGLLLEDQWSLKGRVVRRRTAVLVGKGPSVTVGTSAPSQQSVERVKTVARATLLHALGIGDPAAPLGLRPDRSVAVIQPGPDGQVAVEGGVLTWTDGRRLVVLRLERGLTRPLSVPTEGVPVVLGSGRAARLAAVPAGLRVQLAGGQGLVATITADLPEDDLLHWVDTLQLG